jgi:hypothetical protein
MNDDDDDDDDDDKGRNIDCEYLRNECWGECLN